MQSSDKPQSILQPKPRKLLDHVRDTLRLKHYSYQTEKSYVQWIRRFILFHHKRHPQEIGVPEIEAFLTYLAVQEKIAASTQNQAFSALLFLYRHVLQIPLDGRIDALRARPSCNLPTVLTPAETRSILQYLPGTYQLIAQLFYGSGLRLREALSLSVKDIDFSQRQLNIRDAKGLHHAPQQPHPLPSNPPLTSQTAIPARSCPRLWRSTPTPRVRS